MTSLKFYTVIALLGVILAVLIGVLGESRPLLVISIVAGTFGIILVVLKPFLVFPALSFIYFANLPGFVLGGVVPANALLLVLAVAALLSAPGYRTRLLRASKAMAEEPPIVAYALFALVIIASLVLHRGDSNALRQAITTVGVAGAFYLGVGTRDDLRRVLWGGLAGSVFIGVAGFIRYWTMPVRHFPPKGVSWFYGTEITLSYSSMLAFYMGLALLSIEARSAGRFIKWLLGVPGLVLLAITSRGATLAWVGAYVTRAAILRPRRGIVLLAVFVALFLTVALQIQGTDFSGASALRNTEGTDIVRVTSGRWILYLAAVKMFREHPLLGVGWEQFRKKWRLYSDVPLGYSTDTREFDVHCSYLQVLTELGVVGFGIYVIWVVAFFRRTAGLWRCSGDDVLCRSAQWLLTGLVGSYWHGVVDNVALGINRMHIIMMFLILAILRLRSE